MSRTFRPREREDVTAVILEFDASPWGYGGALYQEGRPQAWFAEAVSKDDALRFDITVGDPKHQAFLETLAILIGIRLWLPKLIGARLCVIVRSDPQAALGAALRLKSPSADINTVVREMALDLAEGKYHIEILEHMPGICNTVADVLSRWFQPGVQRVVPSVLVGVGRDFPAQRRAEW